MKAIILNAQKGESSLENLLTNLKESGISDILVDEKNASTGSLYSLWQSKKELFSEEFIILDGSIKYEKKVVLNFIHEANKTVFTRDGNMPLVKIGLEDLSLFWGRVEEIIQNDGAQKDYLKACDVLNSNSVLVRFQIRSFLKSIRDICKFFLQSFIPAFFYRPLEACRYFGLYLAGSLTPKGFYLQIYGSKLLKIALEESQKIGLNPFLVWGTLLGCVRDGGFIINDDDLDFAVLSQDFPKVRLLIEPMLKRGFTIRNDNEHQISFHHPKWHKSFAVDIDRVYQKDGHMVITTVNEGGSSDFSHLFPMDTFSATKKVKFIEGIDVLIPSQPEIFLQSAYGNWKAPQKKGHYAFGYLNFVLEPKKVSLQK